MTGRRKEERRGEKKEEMTPYRDAHYHSYAQTHNHTHTHIHTHTYIHTQLLTSNS